MIKVRYVRSASAEDYNKLSEKWGEFLSNHTELKNDIDENGPPVQYGLFGEQDINDSVEDKAHAADDINSLWRQVRLNVLGTEDGVYRGMIITLNLGD